MARFVQIPKNGWTVLVNADHVQAVTYQHTKEDCEKHRVEILGAIELKNDSKEMKVYGHVLIEFAEFDKQEDAEKFIEQNFLSFIDQNYLIHSS